MKHVFALRMLPAFALLLATAGGSAARAAAPLYDPVFLNIGINCQWQQRCERQQRSAMSAAGKFIAARHPPLWKIHLCNKNARRGTSRVDWVGFNRCLRNKDVGLTGRRR